MFLTTCKRNGFGESDILTQQIDEVVLVQHRSVLLIGVSVVAFEDFVTFVRGVRNLRRFNLL